MKQKRRSWRLLLGFGILLLLGIGIWLFWGEISWRTGWQKKNPGPVKQTTPAQEKLFEEDRRKLDEVLRQRQSK
jgi:hypothetical protein